MRSNVLLGGLTMLLCANAAWAQTDASPDAEYSRAGRLRREQHPEEALAIYQRLAEQTRDPRAMGERGITEAQMGRWVAAEEHLVAALATSDRWVRHHRDTLQSALETARQHLADLTVTCNISGATLRVDGTPAGTLPRATPVRVTTGPVVIDVSADGHDPHRRTVQAASGTNRVEVTLVPTVETPRTPATVVTAQVPVQPVAPTPAVAVNLAPVAPPRPVESTGSALPALRVTSFALGAVGIGVGVVGTLLRNDAAQTAVDCQSRVGDPSCDYTTLEDRYNTMNGVAIAGFVAGGVFTAAGIALLFVGPSRPREQSTAWVCGPGPGTIGLGCRTQF